MHFDIFRNKRVIRFAGLVNLGTVVNGEPAGRKSGKCLYGLAVEKWRIKKLLLSTVHLKIVEMDIRGSEGWSSAG